ncbi:MAG: hypothetical protein ABI683_15420 [Ginsengibacter sp.]
MILVCGIPSEPPIELLTDELDIIGAKYVMWNQREFNKTDISFFLTAEGRIIGTLQYGDHEYDLEKFTAIYSRLTDWNTLPEIENDSSAALRKKCEHIHVLLQLFIDNSFARVINRSEDMMSNNSKPYQMFLAKEAGLNIPDTLVTTNKEMALDFYEEKQKDLIYKSISGTRSIVQKLKEDDLPKLDKLFFCPTQFQEFVEGQNMRVHVINENTIATLIDSKATDYRYAAAGGGEPAKLNHTELKAKDKLRCIEFSRDLGLFFSGLDFKENVDGMLTCFEANPMPGYSYYEQSASQPIAYTLACELQKIDNAIT